jgi:hypothetical protein
VQIARNLDASLLAVPPQRGDRRKPKGRVAEFRRALNEIVQAAGIIFRRGVLAGIK